MSLLKPLMLAATLAVAGNAAATTISFDDVGGLARYNEVFDGYGNLDWNDFFTLNTASNPLSGYTHAAVSPDFVAFNSFGAPASFSSTTSFNLNSAYLTAAWRNGLSVDVTGYLDNVAVYTKSILLDTSGPNFVRFNWEGIDRVGFVSHGGTYAGFSGRDTQFGMDNLTINEAFVPEPISIALVGLGLTGLVWSRRRKRAGVSDQKAVA